MCTSTGRPRPTTTRHWGRARPAGGSSHGLNGTPYALRLGSDGTWQLRRTGSTILSGSLSDFDATAWHHLALRVAGAQVTGFVDGSQVFTWVDNTPFLSGRVDLASGFHYTQFDNLRIERVPGYLPYYGELLDNLEHHDLASPPTTKLVYGGAWRHANGGGMYEYQRSSSTSQEPGATLSYTFTGSGLDVTGPNNGSARLNVLVDGELVATNQATWPATNFQQTYALRGLPWGEHTVTLEVIAGTLVVDSVGVADTPAAQPASSLAVAQALTVASSIERSADFTDQEWALLQGNIASAGLAVADPAGYRLDGEGAQQLIARLQAASFPLANRVASLPQVWRATYVGEVPGTLPATLPATLTDGTTRELPVTWSVEGIDFGQAFATVAVRGAYGTATTTAWVEVVPRGLSYFADVNGTAAGSLGYESPAYRAVAELVGDGLRNGAADQLYEDGATWGLGATNAAGGRDVQYKGIVAGDYSKTTTTGVYTANQVGATLSYTFTLPAGRHTIVAGSNSWWPSPSRGYDVFLDYDGVAHQVASQVTLDTGTPSRVLSYDVDLAADGPVTIRLRATNNQSPMLSWAAAVSGAYSVTYDLNGGSGTAPESRTGLLWTDAGLDAPGTGLTRPAFTFAGWNTAADGSGVSLTGTTPIWALGGTAVTLYALWVPAVPAWEPSTVYTEGDLVYHAGSVFEAQWWTQNETPGASPWGAWAELASYVRCGDEFVPAWTSSWIYTGGEQVVHGGQLYRAQWWTRNQVPGDPYGPWAPVSAC